MFGKVGNGQTDIGQEGPGQHIYFFTRDQFLGRAYRIAGIGVVILDDQLQLLAVNPPGLIDLLNRQLHSVSIGPQKRGLGFIAVQLPDLDHPLGGSGGPQGL